MRETNVREGEYYEYLSEHINNVRKSWDQFLKDVILLQYPESYESCFAAVMNHDLSKYEDEEFIPYCDYFYPTEGCPKDEVAFDYAWLHHQKVNPHHWQYWVLIRDSGKLEALDMPLSEIVNMLCDWHSFSSKDPESTAYNWYENNKDNMILSDNTREMVTFLLQYLQNPIEV